MDISAPLSVHTDRNAGAFDHLEGHGRLTLPGRATEMTFYSIKGVQDLYSSSRPYLRAGPDAFQLTARDSSDFRLDRPFSTANALDKEYCGNIGENAIPLHICPCGAAESGTSCHERYGVAIDLGRTPPHDATDQLLSRIRHHAILFLWPAPVFILMIRKAYKPWGAFATVLFLVALAPLSLGLTWLVALASSIGNPILKRIRTRRAPS